MTNLLTFCDCFQLEDVTLSFEWLGNKKIIKVPMYCDFNPKTLGPSATIGEIEEAQQIAAQVVKVMKTIKTEEEPMNVKVYGICRDTRWEMSERRQKMETIKQNCLDLQIEVPPEVSDFLSDSREVDLSNVVNYYGECRPSIDVQERGIEICLKDVPETVKTIRVVL